MNDVIIIDKTEIRKNDNDLYCLNDLHEASGGEKRHRPAYFLATDQAKEMILEIYDADIPASYPVKTVQGKGKNQGTFVKKELVYAYAMWVSSKFAVHVIQTYDRIVQCEHAQLEELQSKLKTAIPKDPNCISSVIGGSPLEAHKFFKKMAELDLVRIETDYKPIYKKFITEKGWAYLQGYSKDGIVRVEPEMHNELMALVANFGVGNQVDIFGDIDE
jgi:hypothetical protein